MRLPVPAALICGLLAIGPAGHAAQPDPSVPTYHGDAKRSGLYVVPGLTWARAAGAHLDAGFDGRVQGRVYAQPLYWHPPGATRGLLIVATEADTIHALDAETGREVWRRAVGAPVPRASLPCGNIDPLGITGTPVIDPQAGVLYFDAMVDHDGGPQHLLFALSLSDGAIVPGWPVSITEVLRARGMAFDARFQGQRGALTLVGNQLYVPFGGHYGDCGAYRGWVVGLDVTGPRLIGAWKTGAPKGGIWALAGTSFDGHALFAATGNTQGAGQWGGGEAVIRLPLDLRWQPGPRAFFAPDNWRDLDEEDADLGGTAPLPVDAPSGRGAVNLLLALGKNGNAYLLDRNEPGGIGRPLVMQHVADTSIITAPAAYRIGDDVVVAFPARASSCPQSARGTGLVALRLSGGDHPRLDPAWCAALDGRGAPIVTTSDGVANPIVWIVGADGDFRLHGFRGDTGQALFEGGGAGDQMGKVRHFATLLATAGRLYVAGDDRVYAFSFAPRPD